MRKKMCIMLVVMLTLLLVSLIHFAAVNSIALATSFNSDLLNYGIFSETEDWWVMFHHDRNHTGYSNSTVPISLCQLWNTTDIINVSVRSSPAIVDDKVFVGSSDKNIYVLNAVTGKKIWNYTTEGAVESSPAIVGDIIFAGSDDHRVYALSVAPPRGQEWNFITEGAVRSSPAVANGMVFFGSLDGYVYALNTDGDLQWKFWTDSPIYSSPAVSGDRVFIGASDGRVYALNVTGRYEWHFVTGDSVESSPAVADGIVFVGSDDFHVYAINETTGRQIWNYTTGGEVKSSPAVAYGRVFIGSMNGSVYALNETTGNFLWNFPTEGFVYSSPAVADGKVFVGSGDNRTYVLNATTGSHICNFTTGGHIYSSPAVARNMVFIGSDDEKVYAFGPENEPPQPHIEPPEKPFILQTVTFNGSKSYDPDGYIVNCTWDFGDGTIIKNVPWGKGEIVTHAYGAVGIYNVTLAVTDYHFIPAHRKTDSTWQLVTVQEAWPMYRHDWNHKGYSTSLAPVTNRTLWNLTIGPPSLDEWTYSSPAIIDGVVYIGSTYGTVYALNATDGSVIWNSPLGGAIHSSPAVADGLVFVGSDDNKVYALYASNGTLRWSYETLGSVYPSPTVANGLVFVGSQDNKVYALDEFAEPGNYTHGDTHIEVWRFETEADVVSSPAVAGGLVLIGSDDKKVYALYASNGTLRWSYETLGSVYPSPTVANGLVFVGSQDNKVYALDEFAEPGNYTHGDTHIEVWRFETEADVVSSPAVAGGLVLIGSDDKKVYALYASNGTLRWSYTTGSAVRSSPAIAHGIVFVGSDDGYVYALNATKTYLSPIERLKWRHSIGNIIRSSPAVADDKVFVGSDDGYVYAYSITGDFLWKTEKTIGSVGWSSPAVAEGKVFIGSTDGIYALRKEDGTEVWSYQTDGPVDSSPAVLNDTLYVASKKGTLYAFRNETHDVAVINVTCDEKRIPVPQNATVPINVSLWNKGSFDETDISITTSYNTTVFNSTSISLARGEKLTIPILWNTTNVPIGNYTICVNATLAPPIIDEDRSDNIKTCQIEVTTGVHDINVTDVKPSVPGIDPTKPIPIKNITCQSLCVAIYVTVKNEGNYTETFNVTAYYNSNVINYTTVTNLPPGENTTVTFTWNTTGVAKGNYTIKAIADTVPGETDVADNTLSDGWVIVAMVGDLTGPDGWPDGKCDMRDIRKVAKLFGVNYPDPNYEPNCDVTGPTAGVPDGKIDMRDIRLVAKHFGETDP